MFLNQVKMLALPLLLIAGTVATGVVVAAQGGGQRDAGLSGQPSRAPRAAATDAGGGEAAQPSPAASKDASETTSPLFVQQINAVRAF